MLAWTDNLDWRTPVQGERCGYVSNRFTPCEHERPCPIHDKLPARDGGAGRSSLPLPAPPLLEPTNQRSSLAAQNRKEEP